MARKQEYVRAKVNHYVIHAFRIDDGIVHPFTIECDERVVSTGGAERYLKKHDIKAFVERVENTPILYQVPIDQFLAMATRRDEPTTENIDE